MSQSPIRQIRPRDNPPLSVAVITNGLVYVSGLVGFKPDTMQPVSRRLDDQCRQMFENLDHALRQAGSSRASIVRCTIYLREVERDFAAMNALYTEWIGGHRPARTTVGATLAQPELLIEMDCIAVVED